MLDAFPPLLRSSWGGRWRDNRGGRLQRLHKLGNGGKIQPSQRYLVNVVHVGQSSEVSVKNFTIESTFKYIKNDPCSLITPINYFLLTNHPNFSYAGCGVIDDNLFVVGGCDVTQCLNTVEMYDSSSNKWSPSERINVPRACCGVSGLHFSS